MRAMLLGIFAASAAVAWTASAAADVYKCTQESGRVLYSDVPCKGASVVDVRPGATDRAAVAQLARDNAAFDRRMAARRAADDAAAMQRQSLNARFEMAQAARGNVGGVEPAYYYDPSFAFVPAPRVKRDAHAHHVARVPEGRVPAKPASPAGVERRDK